ncbi:MAG TPA: hypothetical protein VGD45_21030 [Steroidobacter sp.]|uniref:hypothetical protein n=1 Tax=Steroidobacter sp. TaxID=1978227 RepID=UPI002EDB83E0
MEKLPFTNFDFWGYLASGFLLLCAVDLAAGYGLIQRENWTIVEGILAISMAYVIGHAVASISSLVLERGLVAGLLGRPNQALFGTSRAPSWLRKLFGFYFELLPGETRTTIFDRAAKAGISRAGEGLFWLAFAEARASERTMARLADFLNQYSFCRNVSLVCFVDAALLQWAHLRSGDDAQLLWTRVSLVVGLVLLMRYLKFLRLYSVELFTSFAHAR